MSKIGRIVRKIFDAPRVIIAGDINWSLYKTKPVPSHKPFSKGNAAEIKARRERVFSQEPAILRNLDETV